MHISRGSGVRENQAGVAIVGARLDLETLALRLRVWGLRVSGMGVSGFSLGVFGFLASGFGYGG